VVEQLLAAGAIASQEIDAVGEQIADESRCFYPVSLASFTSEVSSKMPPPRTLTPRTLTIGLISDTHGLLRPGAVEALRGSDAIVHAGDIGDAKILAELSRLAPVTAVRGNIDRGAWASSLPETAVLQIGDAVIFIHNVAELDLDPAAAGFLGVVSGHSHLPGWREKDGVLFVNPGSAGPRRFTLPIALGRLRVAGKRVTAELIELES
jgi:putative phosphoesterase